VHTAIHKYKLSKEAKGTLVLKHERTHTPTHVHTHTYNHTHAGKLFKEAKGTLVL
jgi:hypothetical protein